MSFPLRFTFRPVGCLPPILASRAIERALKPGGRLAISDIIFTAELPAGMQAEAARHTGCVAGGKVQPGQA